MTIEENNIKFYHFIYHFQVEGGIGSARTRKIASVVVRVLGEDFFNHSIILRLIRIRVKEICNHDISIYNDIITSWHEIKKEEYINFNEYTKRDHEQDLTSSKKYIFHYHSCIR